MELEIRLYNSLHPPGGPFSRRMQVEDRITVGRLVEHMGIPGENVYVAFRNGRPLGRGLRAAAAEVLEDGDVLALSGPIPFSNGYGSPVI